MCLLGSGRIVPNDGVSTSMRRDHVASKLILRHFTLCARRGVMTKLTVTNTEKSLPLLVKWVNLQRKHFHCCLLSTGWRPVVAVFCNNSFFITDIIVLNDSIFWLHILGVTVGIILTCFFEIDYSMCL